MARVLGAGKEVDRPRALRIVHVDYADAVRIAVADIGIAAMDHDLDTVAAPTLVGCNRALANKWHLYIKADATEERHNVT
jgi:hypothetical protein